MQSLLLPDPRVSVETPLCPLGRKRSSTTKVVVQPVKWLFHTPVPQFSRSPETAVTNTPTAPSRRARDKPGAVRKRIRRDSLPGRQRLDSVVAPTHNGRNEAGWATKCLYR